MSKTVDQKKWIWIGLEAIFLNGFVFGLFFLLNSNREWFIQMNIHPFIFVIALMAIIYGNYAGLLCATISSALFVSAYILLGKDPYLFISEFVHYKFLLMFYLTAAILGYYSDHKRHIEEDLQEEQRRVRRDLTRLTQDYKKMSFIKDELKKQIIGAEQSILALYEIASSLESLETESIYTELIGVLTQFIHAKSVSIYTVTSSQFLRLKIRLGESQWMKNSIALEDFPLMGEILQTRVTFRNTGQANLPLLVAPILANNQVVGIVMVEEIEFSNLTEYTFQVFKLVMDWTQKSLARAILHESTTEKKAYFPKTRLLRPAFFDKRLSEEQKRAKRFELPFAVLEYSLPEEIPKTEIDHLLRSVLREVDQTGYDEKGGKIRILLPLCNPDTTAMVAERLEKKFDYHLTRVS